MYKKINLLATFALIILPIIVFIMCYLYIRVYGIGLTEICLFILGYYGCNIAVGVGLHRLWSHESYKTNKYIEFILALLSSGTLQGPILSWASNHLNHHRYTDTEHDPHSPFKYKNPIKGFLWAHIGWMLVGEGSYKFIDRITMVKLGKNKILKWQLRYYWQIATIMNTIVPALVGILIGQKLLYAYAGIVFIGMARICQQHLTFCVNSLCHFLGSKGYTKGTAGDIWWLAILLLGENWHNFHHAFPSDYRNGVKWYHFDVHKWIIYIMNKLGLAWDLKRTANIRVNARISQTIDLFISSRREQLTIMLNKVHSLTESMQSKIKEIDQTSNLFIKKCSKTYFNLNKNLTSLNDKLNFHLKELNNTSDRIVKAFAKEVKKTEKAVYKFYSNIEHIKSYI